MNIDLHVHSAFSDGLLSPEALCALALQQQVTVLALCDHDTTDGLQPMRTIAERINRDGHRLTVIPAVELSTGADGHTHLLGYGVQENSPDLQAAMAELRAKRVTRGQQMVEALKAQGVQIPAQMLPEAETPGMPIGRPHVARALIRMGVVNTMEQAFDRYLAEGKPGYVPLEHLSAAQAVGILRRAGAVPVLAHPARIGLEPQALEALVGFLQEEGLLGVEVYHPSASRRDTRAFEAMARRRGLLVTGGSDYHGDRGTRARLGGLPSGWRKWREDLAALQTAMQLAQTRTEAV